MGQRQGGGGAVHLMEGQQGAEIQVAQPAAGEHQGVLLPQKPGAGRQQLQLPRPPAGQPREAHPQLLPVPHRILHHAGQAWEGHTDLPHAVAAEQPGLVGQQGLVEQGQQG